MSRNRAAQVFVLASLVWGTLAFGATYEWASRSLAGLGILATVLCLAAGRRAPGPGKWYWLTLVLMLCAIGVQLIPWSQSTISGLNPARHDLLQRLYVGYRFNPSVGHAISINPPATLWALVFCAVCATWAAGLSKLLAVTGAEWLIKGLTALGVAIALIGIVQNALYDGRVYGFWTPENQYAGPFGPFINKNHFAGWMVMVLPMTLALVMSQFQRAVVNLPRTLRDRFMWLSSEAASRLILVAAAAAMMALALLLTLSRSGIIAMTLALIIPAALVLRRGYGPRGRRLVVALAPLLLFVLLLIWVGPDVIDRLRRTGEGELRFAAWADALEIGRRFSLAGTGLNTYGTATLILQQRLTYMHFAQAHNDYLQLWVEGGILLVVPALLWAVAIMSRIIGSFRRHATMDALRVGAVVGIAAILLQEFVDFSLQMPGNLLLFATLCAIAIHQAPAKSEIRRSGTRRATV